jgi:1-acyl-sn-glycerol-3-phosphate acyltransferase
MGSLLGSLRRHARLTLSPWDRRPPLDQRDPAFIADELSWLGPLTDAWFAPDIGGLEHLPDRGALCVGTHNGGLMAPDMFSLMVAFWRAFGPERPAYGLAHDQSFRTPWVGSWLSKLGAVPARPGHARTLLARGASVLVYPGGEIDAFKPYRERHQVKFADRNGFVRTALRARVPIVPVISTGAHEGLLILTDGAELARVSGLKRWARIEVFPVALCLPWGVAASPFFVYLAVPTRVRVRLLPPIDLGLGPEAADDEATVRAISEQVQVTMQRGLDALVAEGGFGPRERLTTRAHRRR